MTGELRRLERAIADLAANAELDEERPELAVVKHRRDVLTRAIREREHGTAASAPNTATGDQPGR